MWFLKLFLSIFLNQAGQEAGTEEGDGSGGQGTQAPDKGTGGAPDAKGKGEPPPDTGQGGQPKYGDFGDSPSVDDVYAKFLETQQQFETLKGKTTQTEQNSAALRHAVESQGFKMMRDEEGNYSLQPIGKSTEKKSRFTDEHRNKLAIHFQNDPKAATEFLEILRPYFEDIQEQAFETYGQRQHAVSTYQRIEQDSIGKMFSLWPSLNPKEGNKSFNKAFHDTVFKRWQEQYSEHPKGQLLAANEVSIEMNILPTAIEEAQKAGYQQGAQQKVILGPTGTGTQTKPGTSGKKLTREQYLALSSEDKQKYDQEHLEK